jgi:hypothetical protein
VTAALRAPFRVHWILWITMVAHGCSKPLFCLPDVPELCQCADGQTGSLVCSAAGDDANVCQCPDARVRTVGMMDGGVSDNGMSPEVMSAPDTGPLLLPDVQRYDTGPISPRCGNGRCDTGEACNSCPSDCGQCPPLCGDGKCNGMETCTSCSGDCGACPSAPVYGQCTSGANCGSNADCQPPYLGYPPLCLPRCEPYNDCPSVPYGNPFPYCNPSRHCWFGCDPSLAKWTCPSGRTCMPVTMDLVVGVCL